MKRYLILPLLLVLFWGCDLYNNEFDSVYGYWAAEKAVMKINYDFDADGYAAKLVLEFTGSNGSSSFTRRITFSGIDLAEDLDLLPNAFDYKDSDEDITITGAFDEFERMTLSVVWDIEYNGIHSSGKQEYILEHLYKTSRFDNQFEIFTDVYFQD